MNDRLLAVLPFLRWFPMSKATLRADLIAGITVALVLVPQSMAYAQLAGLPVVYGLYAAFVPVVVASLWGSSNQLHTGPVAMLSLMSAAAVVPFAAPGSATFIEISILLALMVGVLRLALGLLRLGVVVNLLSSPVIVGFTNAAALIIGLSQLSQILGVPFPRSDSYLYDLWHVLIQIPQAHWPTVMFAAGAWLIIAAIGRYVPKLPGVLITVLLATAVSAAIGFERKQTVALERIEDPQAAALISDYAATTQRIEELTNALAAVNARIAQQQAAVDPAAIEALAELKAESFRMEQELALLKSQHYQARIELHTLRFVPARGEDPALVLQGSSRAAPEGSSWRFAGVDEGEVTLSAGGAVIGHIPQGLPAFGLPELRWDLVPALAPAALLMALIGFMEATSISKAIATSTGQRIDTNKELVGQGLANIAGSMFGSYTVSGSFSRSAVAARMGAVTGLFAVISAIAVMIVLLFFTPYLYHLPKAVLAVIVMMAVFGLIRIAPLSHAVKVEPLGAAIGITTFVATLWFAPSLADGILVGIVLTILLHLFRLMKPRAEVLGYTDTGLLAGIKTHNLPPVSREVVPVRFDGSLTFVNVAYFEDIVLEAIADYPNAKVILVIGSGINEMDASGEEKVRDVARQLGNVGVTLAFSSLKHQVRNVFERSGLVAALGEENFFAGKDQALSELQERYAGGEPPAGSRQGGGMGGPAPSGAPGASG